MPFDLDAMIEEARRRIHKMIEIRYQLAAGRPPSTAHRSAGQLYKRKTLKAEIADLEAMPDSQIDYSDIPSVDQAPERLKNGTVGKFYRGDNDDLRGPSGSA